MKVACRARSIICDAKAGTSADMSCITRETISAKRNLLLRPRSVVAYHIGTRCRRSLPASRRRHSTFVVRYCRCGAPRATRIMNRNHVAHRHFSPEPTVACGVSASARKQVFVREECDRASAIVATCVAMIVDCCASGPCSRLSFGGSKTGGRSIIRGKVSNCDPQRGDRVWPSWR